MKVVKVHSHLNGKEWIQVHHPELWDEIENAIGRVDAEACKTKVSKEKTKKGTVLYSPIAINKHFKKELQALNWDEVRTDYWVTDDIELIRKTLKLSADDQKQEIEAKRKRATKSYNQTDFQKHRVAIEVQFGKYPSLESLAKHQALYLEDRIDVGVEIVATKEMQNMMSSGAGYYEGGCSAIVGQGRGCGFPAVPLVLIGVVP